MPVTAEQESRTPEALQPMGHVLAVARLVRHGTSSLVKRRPGRTGLLGGGMYSNAPADRTVSRDRVLRPTGQSAAIEEMTASHGERSDHFASPSSTVASLNVSLVESGHFPPGSALVSMASPCS